MAELYTDPEPLRARIEQVRAGAGHRRPGGRVDHLPGPGRADRVRAVRGGGAARGAARADRTRAALAIGRGRAVGAALPGAGRDRGARCVGRRRRAGRAVAGRAPDATGRGGAGAGAGGASGCSGGARRRPWPAGSGCCPRPVRRRPGGRPRWPSGCWPSGRWPEPAGSSGLRPRTGTGRSGGGPAASTTGCPAAACAATACCWTAPRADRRAHSPARVCEHRPTIRQVAVVSDELGDGDGDRGGQPGVAADLRGDLPLHRLGQVAAVVSEPGRDGARATRRAIRHGGAAPDRRARRARARRAMPSRPSTSSVRPRSACRASTPGTASARCAANRATSGLRDPDAHRRRPGHGAPSGEHVDHLDVHPEHRQPQRLLGRGEHHLPHPRGHRRQLQAVPGGDGDRHRAPARCGVRRRRPARSGSCARAPRTSGPPRAAAPPRRPGG